MSIKRNVCVTTLALTATAAALQAQAQEEIRPLSDWDYEEVYEQGGIRADNLMDAEVFGEDEEEIGSVENVLVTQDNKIAAIIAQVGGFWDIGDTHVLVPWDEVEIHEDGVRVPVTEENAEDYGLFASDEYITQNDLSRTQQVDDDVETGSGFGSSLTCLMTMQRSGKALVMVMWIISSSHARVRYKPSL
ncbi:hypothetical protein HSBAA_61220 [Vreelandella sulfidaeris]|uniref:PRC-barrel domain-containing protein n=1 Tax=Vreelandella sulfidaeris TaxID=115553 RepID=A0A455UEV1_9GAMM|nr:hypothetical protein HSBAA_61220 [Halomonas sulfidaeris]